MDEACIRRLTGCAHHELNLLEQNTDLSELVLLTVSGPFCSVSLGRCKLRSRARSRGRRPAAAAQGVDGISFTVHPLGP